jgi:hypothetical protein
MNKLLSLIFIILTLNVTAQVSWQRVPVPAEAVASVTVNSAGIVFLGTYTYGVFMSVDDGITWQNISAGLGDSTILQLQSSSDDKIFATTASHGIYAYSIGSWSPVNMGLPNSNISAVSFAKGPAGEMFMMASSGKIYHWKNNSWTDITFNFPSIGKAVSMGPGNILYAAAFAAGVLKFDGVNNWTLVGFPMPNNYVTKITVSNADTIYAACNSNNIFKCAVTGGNWILVNAGLPAADMNFIVTDAANNVFTGTNTSYGSLYRLMNGGTSWINISTGIYTTAFNCLGISSSNKIYTGASGIFKSVDGGDSWMDMSNNLIAPKTITCFAGTSTGILFAGTRNGPWRSLDNGQTWQLKNKGIAHPGMLQIMETASGALLCHGINNVPKGAIYRSTDKGENWVQVAANGTDMYTKIKQHKSDTIWATTRFSGASSLSWSIDDGATWINTPLKISAVWDIDFSKDHTIFLGSESEGVSRSENGGQTFTLGVGNTIPWYGNVLEVETDASGVVFAGGDWWTHILWFSKSNGNDWVQFTDNDLTIHGLQDLLFDEHNNAYIADESNGVLMAYNSDWNAGTDWIESSTGLPGQNPNIRELGFDHNGYLYAVCYTSDGHNGGLFKTLAAINPPDSSVYTFSGNGNWSDAGNWSHQKIPPPVLSGNQMILVNPAPGGECILDIEQHVSGGAILKLQPNAKFRVTEGCILQ